MLFHDLSEVQDYINKPYGFVLPHHPLEGELDLIEQLITEQNENLAEAEAAVKDIEHNSSAMQVENETMRRAWEATKIARKQDEMYFTLLTEKAETASRLELLAARIELLRTTLHSRVTPASDKPDLGRDLQARLDERTGLNERLSEVTNLMNAHADVPVPQYHNIKNLAHISEVNRRKALSTLERLQAWKVAISDPQYDTQRDAIAQIAELLEGIRPALLKIDQLLPQADCEIARPTQDFSVSLGQYVLGNASHVLERFVYTECC